MRRHARHRAWRPTKWPTSAPAPTLRCWSAAASAAGLDMPGQNDWFGGPGGRMDGMGGGMGGSRRHERHARRMNGAGGDGAAGRGGRGGRARRWPWRRPRRPGRWGRWSRRIWRRRIRRARRWTGWRRAAVAVDAAVDPAPDAADPWDAPAWPRSATDGAIAACSQRQRFLQPG